MTDHCGPGDGRPITCRCGDDYWLAEIVDHLEAELTADAR